MNKENRPIQAGCLKLRHRRRERIGESSGSQRSHRSVQSIFLSSKGGAHNLLGEQNRCREAKWLNASHFVARIIYVDYGTKVDREETREEVLPKMESASPLCVRIRSGLGAHLSFQHGGVVLL